MCWGVFHKCIALTGCSAPTPHRYSINPSTHKVNRSQMFQEINGNNSNASSIFAWYPFFRANVMGVFKCLETLAILSLECISTDMLRSHFSIQRRQRMHYVTNASAPLHKQFNHQGGWVVVFWIVFKPVSFGSEPNHFIKFHSLVDESHVTSGVLRALSINGVRDGFPLSLVVVKEHEKWNGAMKRISHCPELYIRMGTL